MLASTQLTFPRPSLLHNKPSDTRARDEHWCQGQQHQDCHNALQTPELGTSTGVRDMLCAFFDLNPGALLPAMLLPSSSTPSVITPPKPLLDAIVPWGRSRPSKWGLRRMHQHGVQEDQPNRHQSSGRALVSGTCYVPSSEPQTHPMTQVQTSR